MTNPVEKTFYSHRIFLVYRPDNFRRYLMDMVDQKTNPWLDSERFTLKLGLMAWGTILVYRARMVPFDFNRQLKALVDENGRFIEQNATLPLSRAVYRQQLAMQLGIEAITRRADVKERIEDIPLFSQYVYDTLYLPSFHHEQGPHDLDAEQNKRRFRVTPETLKRHLWFRAQGNPKQKPPADFPPADVVRFLFHTLQTYFKLLADPKEICNETINYAHELPAGEDQRLWLALAEAADIGRPLVEFETTTVPVLQ